MYLAIGAGASVCYAAFLCIGVCPPAVQYVLSRNAKQLVISVEHRISVRFYMASSNERVYKLYNDSCTGIQIYTHTHIYNMMYIYIYIYMINNVYIYMRPRGKGRKRAWQGAWHENTKGTAQLRSFFVNVDERV